MLPKSNKIIYFVRHGQSIDNTLPVFQSNSSPLSRKGENQAIQIASRLDSIPFEILITSNYLRAVQTAKIIANTTKRDIEFSDLFIERKKPTSIDGKPRTDDTASATWKQWEESLYNPELHIEDGENYSDIVKRSDNALKYLTGRPEKSIVVVSHGYFIRAIIARVLLGDNLSGKTLNKIQTVASMENTAISVLLYNDSFEKSDRWRLWTYNDHAHFAD